MGARAVIKVYFLLCFLFIFSYHHVRGAEFVSKDDKRTMYLLVQAMWEMVQSSFSLMDGVEALRQKHVNKPSFEVGYLMFTIFEKYRKMIDKYTTAIFMDKQLFKMELVMYLEEIENHHWEVEHLANMLHEVERKYRVITPLDSKYREMTSEELREKHEKAEAAKQWRHTIDMIQTRKTRIQKAVLDRLFPSPKTQKPTKFPFDYGWRRM